MASLKELSIKDYVSKIDFNGDWSMNKIREDMRKFLGEEPGIDVIYKKDILINEIMGETKEISKVNKFQVVFTDLDNNYKKIEFLID